MADSLRKKKTKRNKAAPGTPAAGTPGSPGTPGTPGSPGSDALGAYRRKRDFAKTREPAGKTKASASGRMFVVQKHRARALHYDFRLDMNGALKSWAVPKGPSLDPSVKVLAVEVEDHPIEYGDFEGVIPEGEYGAGAVMIWDKGEWAPVGDPVRGYEKGDLKFRLHGQKLNGEWALVRMKADREGRGERAGKNWLLMKKRDAAARSRAEFDALEDRPESVVSGRNLDEIAADRDLVWTGGKAQEQGKKKQGKKKPRNRAGAAASKAVDPPSRLDAGALPGARKAAFPKVVKPQLATAAHEAPAGEEWLHEIKHDGYRLMMLLRGGEARLISRNGLDWTARFANVARAGAALPLDEAVLDGEAVVLDKRGIADFSALQAALSRKDRTGFVLFLFDVVHANGFDLSKTPLVERKAFLKRVIEEAGTGVGAGAIRFSDHVVGKGAAFAREGKRAGLEGIVSKRRDAKYEQRRSTTWLKIKFAQHDEFVVGGFTRPTGSRQGLGALALGRFDGRGGLIYRGRVGSGFDAKTLKALATRLEGMVRKTSPFAVGPKGPDAKGVLWVEPEMVVETKSSGWTTEGYARHAVFLGAREDMAARDVVEEGAPAAGSGNGGEGSDVEDPPRGAGDAAKDRGDATGADGNAKGAVIVKKRTTPDAEVIGGVRITHAARPVYPQAGITKGDVARYYLAAAARMLPHIAGRPLSVVRCPDGVEGTHFFQRRPGAGWPEGIETAVVEAEGRSQDAIVVRDEKGLIGLAQMGVLEIHAWGCMLDEPVRPDMLVFDLDPGEGVKAERVVKAALIVRDSLAEAGLRTFVKTSGGKGLHVVAPVARRAGWEETTGFARAVAEALAASAPGMFTASMSKARRKGKVFVDYLRNQFGATAAAVYSTRARDSATVSMPVAWEGLSAETVLSPPTMHSALRRISRGEADPWAEFFEVEQEVPEVG